MRLQCVPECPTFPSPEMKAREAYAYPPTKRGSRVLEHTSQAWHATPQGPDSTMWTSTEEDAPSVLEHSANTWHDTPDEPVQTALEHTQPEAKLFDFNDLGEWHSVLSLEEPMWHATREDALDHLWRSTPELDDDALEHAADLWHATVSEAGKAALEHTLCACQRKRFCFE